MGIALDTATDPPLSSVAPTLFTRARLVVEPLFNRVNRTLRLHRPTNDPTDPPVGYAPRHALPSLVNTAPRWKIAALSSAVAAVVIAATVVASVASGGTPTRPSSIAMSQDAIVAPSTQYSYSYDDSSETAPSVDSTPPVSPTAVATTPVSSAANVVLVSDLASNGIPSVALLAYQHAAAQYDKADPSCKLSWPLLAAIGRVESNHGQFAGSVLRVDGTSTPRIIGIALNGVGTALVRATVLGVQLDGDHQFDHAVGPMQIIPSTWSAYALAATGHATADPFNIYDAATTAARYLCTAGGDLTTLTDQQRAVLAYNHSDVYLNTVLSLEQTYAAQANISVPAVPTTSTPLPAAAPLPPANPGTPPAIPTTPSTTPSTSTPVAVSAPSGSAQPVNSAASSIAPSRSDSLITTTPAPTTATPSPVTPTPTPSGPPASASPTPSTTPSAASPTATGSAS